MITYGEVEFNYLFNSLNLFSVDKTNRIEYHVNCDRCVRLTNSAPSVRRLSTKMGTVKSYGPLKR
jgi:hypothetical protein